MAGAEGRDISAEIGQRLDPQRQETPIAVERKLGARQVIAPLIVGDEAFAPCRDPFDRPVQTPRRPGDDRLLGIMLALVAEAAADIGCDQANAAFGHAELLGDIAADVMRHLRRAIERELVARCIRDGQHRSRLDRAADQAVIDEVEPRDVRGLLHRLADGSFVAPRPAKADIAGRGLMQLRRVSRFGDAGIDQSRQGRIVDRRGVQRHRAPARASRR